LVNTIEGLTEEQAVEIVTRAETLAEEQTEELPRRKGSRAAAEELLGVEAGPLLEGDEAAGATDVASDLTDGEAHQTQPDTSTAEPGSALPAAPAGAVGGDLSPDDAPDWERDEASDDEIHDVALAVESSGLSGHGHEVTSPPRDDDQRETIRIVTEAVEHGETGRPPEPPPAPAESSQPDHPGATTVPSSPRAKRAPREPEEPTGAVS
jgi:N utilization substance protein A